MKVQDSEILRRSSVFRFLADEHFAAIEPLLQEEHYEFGDVIVKQDDPADSFYVLTRGRARALVRWSKHKTNPPDRPALRLRHRIHSALPARAVQSRRNVHRKENGKPMNAAESRCLELSFFSR